MDDYRVVLVGCGGISRAWLEAARDYAGLTVVGLVDVNLDQARKLQGEFDLAEARIGADLDEMLTRADANFVFDCTIPEAHAAVTLTALQRGCHVLGEKPMAENMTQAETMLNAAHASGKIYAVMQNRRYLDPIVRFRHLLASQAIGALTTINADFYLGAHFGGFRDVMEHVLLLDMAIHSFDQARYLSGADPVAVYCHEWNPSGSWYRHGASAVAIFEMSNGVVFNYRGSWCAEGLNTSWECAWRAIGETGSAIWDGHDGITAECVAATDGFLRPQKPVPIPELPKLAHVGHAGVIHDVLDSVKADRLPQTICTDNIKSLAMVHAAIESAATGQKVMIHK
jgi:predicted dehydrogenase